MYFRLKPGKGAKIENIFSVLLGTTHFGIDNRASPLAAIRDASSCLLFVCLFVCLLSVVCLFVCLLACLFVCLSVCLFVCLSVCVEKDLH